MRKLLFIILLLVLILFPAQRALAGFKVISDKAQDYFCAFYFTYIGCPNCAHTDPIVLTEWTKKYPNLVIIEYGWHGGDFKDPNSQFFGKYASAYKVPAGVPQFVISKNNVRLGRIEVPKAEDDIKAKKVNPCPLIDKSISFENLDLSQLSGNPKIWANGRILIKTNKNEWLFQWNGEKPPNPSGEKFSQKELKSLLFTDNIYERLKNKAFDIVNPQKAEFSGTAFPGSKFVPYCEFENAIKINISKREPMIAPQEKEGPQEKTVSEAEETINIPFVGKIETKKFSLLTLTLLMGLADGFNPCAFFVLTFLLAALIGLTGARKKILLVGGIFIFFSALFYFLFMSILLNIFQFGGKITALTIIAGIIAVFAGIVNIKDYFYFQKGISLTLPKSYKEKFLARVKALSLAKSTWALIIGTIIIAATVNIYELLCTFGFPMVYNRILSLRELTSLEYYLYLIFYNLVYIIPLAVIVLIFAATLGKKTFSQIWVRRLKLVSGFMILLLGLALMLKPKLLESPLSAFSILLAAIAVSALVIFLNYLYHRKFGR